MTESALTLVKARIGITSTVRDAYLTAIINGIIKELETIQGITIDKTNQAHLMFVVDYVEYRYSNKDNPIMPRHLQFRLHNLMVSGGGSV